MIASWIDRRSANDELISEIKRMMMTHHLGRANAATKDMLLWEFFGVNRKSADYDLIERAFRKCVEMANYEDGALIVSDVSVGYWWASSLDDGLIAAHRHLTRARTMASNAERLVDNLKKAYGGQMGLGL